MRLWRRWTSEPRPSMSNGKRRRNLPSNKGVPIMQNFTLPVVIEKDENGYFASCPSLQGCYTQGDTYEEVLANIEDAIRLHIEDRLANGEPIPTGEMVSLT